MLWVILIVLILLVLVTLLFRIALKVKLIVNSDKSDMHMKFNWLNPFLKALVRMEDSGPLLTVYLFNRKFFSKVIKKGENKHSALDLVKASNPEDVHVDVNYGFRDPFETGMACGAINIASQFINIDSIKQTPDFVTNNDYIYLHASAKVNIGSAVMRYLRLRSRD